MNESLQRALREKMREVRIREEPRKRKIMEEVRDSVCRLQGERGHHFFAK